MPLTPAQKRLISVIDKDKDKDGKISFDEYFGIFDNNSDKVNESENSVYKKPSERLARISFNKIDKDNNNYLSISEALKINGGIIGTQGVITTGDVAFQIAKDNNIDVKTKPKRRHLT